MRLFPLLALVFLTPLLAAQAQVAEIIRHFHDRASTKVLVVAHRADWRNAPENSLRAIDSAIALGADIIEIDIRRTRDGVLVIMHDDTLDRTTTGKGLVSDHTWAELRELRLRDGLNSPTTQKIPTLEEALLAVKGRAMVNLDRCYPFFAEAMALLEKTGTVDHAIFKSDLPAQQLKAELGPFLERIAFMPIIRLDQPGAPALLDDYLRELNPPAVEFIFASETPQIAPALQKVAATGTRIWINSLWSHHNAGHDDERALDDPDGTWGWLLAQHVNIIQTDRPALLINYLARQARR